MYELFLAGIEKISFWLFKHISKEQLKKRFPLKEEDFQIKLESMPFIYIDEVANHCNLSFSINLRNYTNYDLLVSHTEISIIINSYHFVNYDKILLKKFRKKEGIQFYVELPITYYQVRKIINMSASGNVLPTNFNIKIFNENVLSRSILNRTIYEKIEVKHIQEKQN